MCKSVDTLNDCQCFNFVANFLENEKLFQKTAVPFFSSKYEIENASFPCKTVLPEANVKTNKMVSTKWPRHKERSFGSNYFIFLKILFQLRTSYTKLI